MRYYLTFSGESIKQPLIYEIGQKFKVITNIRQATVSDQLGLMAVELTGEEDEINKSVQYLQDNGVRVEPLDNFLGN